MGLDIIQDTYALVVDLKAKALQRLNESERILSDINNLTSHSHILF